MDLIGPAVSRVDAPLKVRGAARYPSEVLLPGLVHAVAVQSTIARGRIVGMQTSAAERLPGVLAVITHANAPKLRTVPFPQAGQARASAGHDLNLLQDGQVHWSGQHIGVVVAETLEAATEAAALIRADYETSPPVTSVDQALPDAFVPEKGPFGEAMETTRGDPEAAYAAAPAQLDEHYATATNNHNPMGLFATTAAWEGEQLLLHDTTQSVHTVRRVVAAVLGLSPDQVRVLAPYVGGAFGSGLRTWPHVVLAAIAARQVRRPVRLVLTRAQMFTSTGQRPETRQHMRLAASRGRAARRDPARRRLAHLHAGRVHRKHDQQHARAVCLRQRMDAAPPRPGQHRDTHLYARPGRGGRYVRARMRHGRVGAPARPRSDRAAPAQPRRRGPGEGRALDSKSLRACFEQGAARIGWDRRHTQPRALRRADGKLVGLGVATAMYPALRMPATAIARLSANGTALVQSGTTDIGTGTYTSMAQVAADTLGLPLEVVRFDLGDSAMPDAPLQGGSMTMASVGSAVQAACLALRARVVGLAVGDPQSPLHGLPADEITVEDGRMVHRPGPKGLAGRVAEIVLGSPAPPSETYAEVMVRNQALTLEALGEARPGAEMSQSSLFSFGAQFAEVSVDPDLGIVHVDRVVGAYACGRIVNARLARSQMIGGIVGGIGQALLEHTQMDPRSGRLVNANLGDYHLPVEADVGDIEILFVEERDDTVNPIGVKGVGELGIIGVSAAIANAVFNATGVRVRDLPITLDKLL